jgi:hypothetical protein
MLQLYNNTKNRSFFTLHFLYFGVEKVLFLLAVRGATFAFTLHSLYTKSLEKGAMYKWKANM